MQEILHPDISGFRMTILTSFLQSKFSYDILVVALLKDVRKSRNVKMRQGKRRFWSESGFSLIELLVVISIITLLIGFLATGIQGVKRHATNLRQKSNFHAVYSSEDPCSPDSFRAPVITDIFRQKKVKVLYKDQPEWAGSPILYYKANSASRLFKKVPASGDDFKKWIYNYEDNRGIIELGTIKDPAVEHHFSEAYTYTYTEDGQPRTGTGVHLFYKTITNPKVSYDKPFNAATFILISAGRDGIYGTSDDITNFDY